MLYADKESNIIDLFHSVSAHEIALIPESTQSEAVLKCVWDETLWQEWTDSSAKDAPTPDFFNDTEKLMMEVMRVDDHGRKKKGTIINPTYMRERELEHELRESGLIDENSGEQKIIINAITELPTEEDHNYRFYFENFRRTVEHHRNKIDNYQRNHPGYKLIFFVFDESSAYFEADLPHKHVASREIVSGHPHYYFMDKRFIDIIKDAGADFFVWYAPFKLLLSDEGKIDLPKACVFDCKDDLMPLIEYDMNKMVSAEA